MSTRTISVYVAIWTGLAVVFAGQSLLYALQAGRPFEAGAALLSSATYWYLWGLLGVVVLRLAARFPLTTPRLRRHAALHAVAGVLTALAHVALRAGAERVLNGSSADGLQSIFVEQFHLDLLVYWGLVGASHALAFHRQALARERETGALASRAAQLETRIATAQLNALRAQLEPHFLFNTLQAISTLLRQDVGLADRTLAQLSALLRRVVDAADVQEVPLADELALAGEYLAIQATRFQTELRVETRVEPGLEQALVPILVLQPLIENACLHGIGRHPSGGRVIVEAERAGRNLLRLRVSNDGPDPRPLAAEGVGLSNSRKRLEALYGERGALAVRPRPGGGAETTVELPLHWPGGAPRPVEDPLPLEAGHG